MLVHRVKVHMTVNDLLLVTAPDVQQLNLSARFISVTVVCFGAVADLAIEKQQLDWHSATDMEQAQQRA